MKNILLAGLLFVSFQLSAQVLPLRQQATVIDEVLSDRLNH